MGGEKDPGTVNDKAWGVQAWGPKHEAWSWQTTMPGKRSRHGGLPTGECECEAWVNFSMPSQKPGAGLPVPQLPVTSAVRVNPRSGLVRICSEHI
jgi:hypothetical protein